MAGEDPRRCLIVDDEPGLRRLLSRLMESDGFTCVEAATGSEALQRLDEAPFILVLTDLRMAPMDGIEFLREIRARQLDAAVVMITAVANVDHAVSCLALGALDYLTKPFQLEEVRARVGQALEKRRLVLENRGYQDRLEERVAAQARRLEELFLASVQSLADALEVKDRYTRGHSMRVSQYATVIAQTLELDAGAIRQIGLGGHVHDIGKIGVREAVLNKPGPLTAEEYAHIMTHPVVGWKILSPLLGDVPMALNIVRSHHERFDGRGIPDGLAANAIPLEARIAAVADAFDAMTSGRPYRGAQLTIDQALTEISANAGTQFDPAICKAFVSAARAGMIPMPTVPLRTPRSAAVTE